MNRRDFLYGCAAVAVASTTGLAVAPQQVLSKEELAACFDAFYKQWQNDTADVFVDYFNNVIIFGCGALRQIEEYPYIESVNPYTLEWPKTTGGLLDKA